MNTELLRQIDGLQQEVNRLEDIQDQMSQRMEDAEIERDMSEYAHLQGIMRLITEEFQVAGVNSEAYQLAWRLSEDIKNQHGGMPPKVKE